MISSRLCEGVGRRFDCLSCARVLPVGGEAVVVLGRHVDDELLGAFEEAFRDAGDLGEQDGALQRCRGRVSFARYFAF